MSKLMTISSHRVRFWTLMLGIAIAMVMLFSQLGTNKFISLKTGTMNHMERLMSS